MLVPLSSINLEGLFKNCIKDERTGFIARYINCCGR